MDPLRSVTKRCYGNEVAASAWEVLARRCLQNPQSCSAFSNEGRGGFSNCPERVPGKRMVGSITAKNDLRGPSTCVSEAHSSSLHILPHLVVATPHYAILDPTRSFHRPRTLRPRVGKSLAQGRAARTWKGCITLGVFLWHFLEMQEGMRTCLQPPVSEAWVQGH